MDKRTISVKRTVKAPVEKVWLYWTTPEHIKNWNFASNDWHTPSAKNDLRENGKFSYRMEAKDGSAGFDFEGIYNEVVPHSSIVYTIEDGRKVHVRFQQEGENTRIEEDFDAENSHPEEMQKQGWQAILDQFGNYVENN